MLKIKSSGQSYKASTIVIYDSRLVNYERKLFIRLTLEPMSYTNLSVAEIKHSDWLLKVTWPVLTNKTSLLKPPVFMFVTSDLGLLSTTGNQSASDHVTTFLRRAKILDSHLKSRSAGKRFYPPPPHIHPTPPSVVSFVHKYLNSNLWHYYCNDMFCS